MLSTVHTDCLELKFHNGIANWEHNFQNCSVLLTVICSNGALLQMLIGSYFQEKIPKVGLFYFYLYFTSVLTFVLVF